MINKLERKRTNAQKQTRLGDLGD